MLLETPQPLLLATTRLQVDKFPRGTVGDARRSLNGALDVRAAKKLSPAFRALWRRRRSRQVPTRAGEARRAVDDHASRMRWDPAAAAAAAALPHCVAGTAEAAQCSQPAPEGLLPARTAAGRLCTPLPASRRRLRRVAHGRAPGGVRGAARTPDALGGKARDTSLSRLIAQVFPARTRTRRPLERLRWWRRCFCVAMGWNDGMGLVPWNAATTWRRPDIPW